LLLAFSFPADVINEATQDQQFLSSFHILALAHVLRRPIIVYAERYILDRDGNRISSWESDVGGIYLPIALGPRKCSTVPICLGFTCDLGGINGHFSALIGFHKHYQRLLLTVPPEEEREESTPAAGTSTNEEEVAAQQEQGEQTKKSKSKSKKPQLMRLRYTSGDWMSNMTNMQLLGMYMKLEMNGRSSSSSGGGNDEEAEAAEGEIFANIETKSVKMLPESLALQKRFLDIARKKDKERKDEEDVGGKEREGGKYLADGGAR
jgi:hypothetical protein